MTTTEVVSQQLKEQTIERYFGCLTDPFRHAPVSIPDSVPVAHVLKQILFESNESIPALPSGASGLLIYFPGDDDPGIRMYAYDATAGTMNFLKKISPSEDLSEDYEYFRHISAGLQVQSSTTSGAAFVIQGTFSAIAFECLPPITDMDPDSVSQYKRANYDAVTSVSAALGVAMISPLVEEYKFRPFKASSTSGTDLAGNDTIVYTQESVTKVVWRVQNGQSATAAFLAGVPAVIAQILPAKPLPWGQFRVEGIIRFAGIALAAPGNQTIRIRERRRTADPATYAELITNTVKVYTIWMANGEDIVFPFNFETNPSDAELETIEVEVQTVSNMTINLANSVINMSMTSNTFKQKQLHCTGLMCAFQNLTQQQLSIRGVVGFEVIPKFSLTRNVPVGYNSEMDSIAEVCRNALINSLGHPFRHVWQADQYRALSLAGGFDLNASSIVARASTKSWLRNIGNLIGVERAIDVGAGMLGMETGMPWLGSIAGQLGHTLWNGITSEGSNTIASTTSKGVNKTPLPLKYARCSSKANTINTKRMQGIEDQTKVYVKMAVPETDFALAREEGWIVRNFDETHFLFKESAEPPSPGFVCLSPEGFEVRVAPETRNNKSFARHNGYRWYPMYHGMIILVRRRAKCSTLSAEEELALDMGLPLDRPMAIVKKVVQNPNELPPPSLSYFRGVNGEHINAVSSLVLGDANRFHKWINDKKFTFQQFPTVVDIKPRMGAFFLSNLPLSYDRNTSFQVIGKTSIPYKKVGTIHISQNIPSNVFESIAKLVERSAVALELLDMGDLYLTALVEGAYFELSGTSYMLALQGLFMGNGSSTMMTGSPDGLDMTDLLRKLIGVRQAGMKLVIYDPNLSLDELRSKLKSPESVIDIGEAMLFGIAGRDAILMNNLTSLVCICRIGAMLNLLGMTKGETAQVKGATTFFDQSTWVDEPLTFKWDGTAKQPGVTEQMTWPDFLANYEPQVAAWKALGSNANTFLSLQKMYEEGNPKLQGAVRDIGSFSLRLKYLKKGVPGEQRPSKKVAPKKSVAAQRRLLMLAQINKAKDEEDEGEGE